MDLTSPWKENWHYMQSFFWTEHFLTVIDEPHPQSFRFIRCGWGPIVCISNKLPGDADAVDQHTLRTTLYPTLGLWFSNIRSTYKQQQRYHCVPRVNPHSGRYQSTMLNHILSYVITLMVSTQKRFSQNPQSLNSPQSVWSLPILLKAQFPGSCTIFIKMKQVMVLFCEPLRIPLPFSLGYRFEVRAEVFKLKPLIHWWVKIRSVS